ncbi:TolC family protein [uncultured Vibrio sp.]|uniref:TolC family protein n=1 Tax=uncultured Vibrio sp. TaxID=114054 RepID=UPI00262329CA|nr:TolC family protein [uncultured Vibrio sp.]
MSAQEQADAKAQLDLLVQQALDNDHGRKQYFAQSQSMRETGVAQSTLMDPKLKVGFGGLPVDSFKFDDDPMTNISVGLMQQFERGSTLDLRQKQANQKADGIGLQVKSRELDVTQSVSQLWLELGYQQYAEQTLKANRSLLVELEQFIQTNYGLGKSEAQDVLNAQLKISQLDEKLQSNAQMQRRLLSQLSEWLGDDWLARNKELRASNQLAWPMLDSYLADHIDSHQHYQKLNQHPMVNMVDASIAATQTQVELAEQAYTPQFGVEVMYAYRQADNMSGPASDLVSAYLTMDIPLFTDNRQDRELSAAQYQVGAARSQKDVVLAQLNARVNALIIDRVNLGQRLERYQSTLLNQSQARTQAVERGYQNNTAQYSDVIQASMDELTLQLEYQRLITDLSVVNSSLAALLGGFEHQVASPQLKIEE